MTCYCPETREEKETGCLMQCDTCFINPANRPLLQGVADDELLPQG